MSRAENERIEGRLQTGCDLGKYGVAQVNMSAPQSGGSNGRSREHRSLLLFSSAVYKNGAVGAGDLLKKQV
ncbi:hypothetical protein SAMN05518684_10769 [Salipaludibacillus aurantiacus]|uniref:Uncharacterized protein n=1 Tax=Salipaludibacillus aurantiacus TaxID=1601833 RepID=A0A1H9UAG9_9BACI|nr:hypothetical protein SAMN05518684_10769 [Salipaludibacillus aurantiacus]